MRRDFVCNTCGASFGTNSVLKMHILSHTDYRAEKCEVRFLSVYPLSFIILLLTFRYVGSVFIRKLNYVVT